MMLFHNMWQMKRFVIAFQFAHGSLFPDCADSSFYITNTSLLAVNASHFVEDGVVGEYCSEPSCEESSVFRTMSSGACALICYKAQGCDWWTAHQTFEGFVNTTVCHLFSSNTTTVPGHRLDNSTSGHRNCSPTIWPGCIERNTFVPATGFMELWIDAVVSLGLPSSDKGCHYGDCSFTDRFHTGSIEQCATTCSRVNGCKFWSVTGEDGDMLCWLRKSVFKLEEQIGAISGNAACAASAPYRPLQTTLNTP